MGKKKKQVSVQKAKNSTPSKPEIVSVSKADKKELSSSKKPKAKIDKVNPAIKKRLPDKALPPVPKKKPNSPSKPTFKPEKKNPNLAPSGPAPKAGETFMLSEDKSERPLFTQKDFVQKDLSPSPSQKKKRSNDPRKQLYPQVNR